MCYLSCTLYFTTGYTAMLIRIIVVHFYIQYIVWSMYLYIRTYIHTYVSMYVCDSTLVCMLCVMYVTFCCFPMYTCTYSPLAFSLLCLIPTYSTIVHSTPSVLTDLYSTQTTVDMYVILVVNTSIDPLSYVCSFKCLWYI